MRRDRIREEGFQDLIDYSLGIQVKTLPLGCRSTVLHECVGHAYAVNGDMVQSGFI